MMTSESPKQVFTDRAKILLDGSDATRGQRVANNLLAFGAFTAIDIIQGKVSRTVQNLVFEEQSKKLEQKLHTAVHERNSHLIENMPEGSEEAKTLRFLEDEIRIQAIRDELRRHESVRSGFEFVGEAVSDKAINDAADYLLNKKAGLGEKQEYAKETAKTISEYANVLTQVFWNDRWFGFLDKNGQPKKFMGILLAEKSMNLINPGNTEAALRLLGELPGFVGKAFHAAKHATDAMLGKNPIGKEVYRYANTVFGKFLLGYHVMNKRIKAVDQAMDFVVAQGIRQAVPKDV